MCRMVRLPAHVAVAVSSVAPLAAGALGAQPAPDDARRDCTVERIIDGDTFVCRGGERIRLLLIDTPERHQEPFGSQATAQLREMIPPGTSVRLALDFEERDRYGRTLAHVYAPDGTWVNREIVRRGFAVPMVIPPNVRHVEEIRAAAAAARRDRVGLWAYDFFEEPRRPPGGDGLLPQPWPSSAAFTSARSSSGSMGLRRKERKREESSRLRRGSTSMEVMARAGIGGR